MDEPVRGGQGSRKDVRKGGSLTHDKANHDSLSGSGAGQGSAHGSQAQSGGDAGPKSLSQGSSRDTIHCQPFPNDPAGLHNLSGSGQDKDETEFGKIATSVNQGAKAGADVDAGAMSAWGGMQKATGYGKEGAGAPDIEKPGYPMQGEATSGGGKGSVKGSVDGGD